MKFPSYLYIFALAVLCNPGLFIKDTSPCYMIYSLCFTIILYITFDFVNKYTENYEQYNVDVKGVDSLVDLLKIQGGTNEPKKIDINNQLFQEEGANEANCWNALGKNQKELEIIKVQLDSYAGSKESVDKLNNQLDAQKKEFEKLEKELKGFSGTKTEIDQINSQIKSYQGEIDTLKQQLSLYNQTETTIGQVNNQIVKIQSTITELNLNITTCNSLNNEKESNITTLTAGILEQGNTIRSLESRINSREGCSFQLDVNPDTPVNGVSWSRVIPEGETVQALVQQSGHYYLNYWNKPTEIRFNRPIRFMSFKGHLQPYADYGFIPSSSNILTLIYKNNGVEVGNQTINGDQMPNNIEYTLGTINSTYTGLIDSIAIPSRRNFWPTFTNFTVSN